MADQQFCLRWNNHQSTLISVFDTLLENGTLVDCTLAAEGQYLKAHKVVLCACSPYLEALLSQHYEKHPIVILKDVKFSELKSMMDYMYRGEVNISQDQLGTFLKAAESLQIKGLSDNGADGDARDVGSTPKAPPPRKPNVPAPSSRSEPARPDSPLTDGSMSPSSRKRRRVRRSSQDEDSHIENNCDLPSQAQSTPVPNIPAATSSITTTPIVKPAIVKPEQTEINRVDTNSLPADVLKKEIEPISEPLLEPKTEYLEDVNNEDSVEDLTLDDDDDMDGMDISNMSNMSNMSRPGPSHGNDISNQGFAAWNLGANQSGTDEVFMAAQEAVNQHRDSQDKPTQVKSLGKSVEIIRVTKTNSPSKTPHEEVQKTTGPRSKENLDEEAIAEAIKLATQSESETSKLLKEVSEEIEESIKKVFVTLNDQQEVVVVIDDQNRVIQELPTLQSIEAVAVDQDELVRTVAQEVDVATEELTTIDQSAIEVSQSFTLVPKEELTTIDQSAIEVSQSFTLVPKKKGRKSGSLNTDDYKFDSETNKYTCKKCGKNYTKKQSIVIHTHQCGKSQNIQTPRQSKQKGDGKSKTSKRSKIPPLEESVARLFTFDEVNNQWACKNCNKTCKSKQSVNTHKIKCGNQMKKCLYCEYVGRSPTAVRVHMMNQHKIIPRLNEDGTWIY